ncbi:PREDICTED: probable inactive purple acid phosphatase 27 [Amphimedon queenslandica]|uniref:Purple acid phosphatase n=1 Tax=Amphimedon queenslandica TaxID=400682 RepID=A0AAN0IF77_AMPQE|nr:PREDICTED: probable inactive purple acid phosphatase 27 [Amphimedon queenslandica]|eukprot:XP_003387473.1 PREDICTED: probable inactive purple acid phosphatase 27 [Amphimedon queenslandica]
MIRWLSLLFLVSVGFCHQYLSPFDFLKYEEAVVNTDPSVVITVTPNQLNKSGDWVTVAWDGVSHPADTDWIGVYAPPNGEESIDPSKIAPVKYQYCKESSTHMSSGKGSFKIRLVNVRTPYVFALLTGGFNAPTLVATSKQVTFSSPNEPLQPHLALTNDPTTLLLTWSTRDSHEPKVKFWQNMTTYIRIEAATSNKYTSKDMCGPPATTVGYIDPGMLHTAKLSGLTPGQEYNYQFGDDPEWSQVFSFRMPPAPSPNASITFIAFGDMGQAQVDDTLQPLYVHAEPPAVNNTNLMAKEVNERDLVLHIGDISYAIGYAGVWDEFFDLIQPISSRVPYMVCGGNHERDYPHSGSYYEGTDSGGECGVPYEMRFQMPRPDPKQHWYGFSLGSVHFVLMSTEIDFTVNSVQYNWLKDHLSSVDRSVTPWLIFAGHRPMYIDSTAGVQAASDLVVSKELQDNIEPLLLEYKVDLAFWGHHHSYQRTCPVAKKVCQDDGTAPVHVVIGMAGQSLSGNIQEKQPDWIRFVDVDDYGYTRISVSPLSLTLEYIKSDGTQKETFTLKHTK